MKAMQTGFTLIELMIALLVVSILVAIAYPSYMDYVLQSRRVQAQGDLLELAQWMERQFTVDGRYTADTSGTARTLPFTTSPSDGGTAYYNLTVSSTAATYTLTATPQSAGGQSNDTCGTLSVTHTGSKSAVKSSTAVADCW